MNEENIKTSPNKKLGYFFSFIPAILTLTSLLWIKQSHLSNGTPTMTLRGIEVIVPIALGWIVGIALILAIPFYPKPYKLPYFIWSLIAGVLPTLLAIILVF